MAKKVIACGKIKGGVSETKIAFESAGESAYAGLRVVRKPIGQDKNAARQKGNGCKA